MISTPDGTLFERFSYDPAATCTPAALTSTVAVPETHDFEVTGWELWESIFETVWWYGFRFPRRFDPDEFDLAAADLAAWVSEFLSVSQEVVPQPLFRNTFSFPYNREHQTPERRFDDFVYFVFGWSCFRRDPPPLVPAVIEGDQAKHIFHKVYDLENPAPAYLDPGRMLLLGLQVTEGGPAAARSWFGLIHTDGLGWDDRVLWDDTRVWDDNGIVPPNGSAPATAGWADSVYWNDAANWGDGGFVPPN